MALVMLLAAGAFTVAMANAFLTDVTQSTRLAIAMVAVGTSLAGLAGYAVCNEAPRTSRLACAALIAVLGLFGFCIAAMPSILAGLAIYAAAEAGHLPSAFAENLFALRRDGSFMAVSGAIAALHPAIWALAYMCHRRLSAQNAYDALRRSSGTVIYFWLLVCVVATAYIFWVGPVARTAA